MIKWTFAVGLVLQCALALAANESDWPEYRGPRGDGTSPNTGMPLDWSETRNIRWKTPIHGHSWSSPIVQGNSVWLTTATKDGHRLSVVRVDRVSGAVTLDRAVFEIEKPQSHFNYNTHASPTPLIEGDRLYVTYGNAGTACLNPKNGEVLWSRQDLNVNHFRGAGSSIAANGDLLFLHFDGIDKQFATALEKKTGKTRWTTQRSVNFRDLTPEGKPNRDGDERKAFATPRLWMDGTTPLLLSQGAKAMYAYHAYTGEEIWRVEDTRFHSAAARPAIHRGLIFVTTGYDPGQLLAIRPGNRGEVVDANVETNSPGRLQVAWKSRRNVPKRPSLLVTQDLLFGIDDGGMATCWEPDSGRVVWNERVGGKHCSCPVAVDGRIYFFDEDGKSTVIRSGPKFEVLATNQLEEGCMASPAISDRSLLVRTKNHLYCIESRP